MLGIRLWPPALCDRRSTRTFFPFTAHVLTCAPSRVYVCVCWLVCDIVVVRGQRTSPIRQTATGCAEIYIYIYNRTHWQCLVLVYWHTHTHWHTSSSLFGWLRDNADNGRQAKSGALRKPESDISLVLYELMPFLLLFGRFTEQSFIRRRRRLLRRRLRRRRRRRCCVPGDVGDTTRQICQSTDCV